MVEVGPGPGGLTRALLDSPAASVTAVEVDPARRGRDRGTCRRAGRLRVVAGDALAMDLAALVPAPRVVVANLPYNVATPLLVGWLRQAAVWERLTLMFQSEVAERICAAAGQSDAYGRLAVLAQWTGTAAVLTRIPAAAFWPPPKVVSAVIGFRRTRSSPPPPCSPPWNG